MRCSASATQFMLRHDILKGILRCAVCRASITSALEPPLRRLPCLAARPGGVKRASFVNGALRELSVGLYR
jgi:hypothetical protein